MRVHTEFELTQLLEGTPLDLTSMLASCLRSSALLTKRVGNATQRRRHGHFVTWPPSMPATPHPHTADAALAPYGWGDWFVASLVSSIVAWPAVFATDVLFGDFLLPAAERQNSGSLTAATAFASLVPKAAASYAGAHLYVPRAWWFWKLSLLPALPLSFGISFAVYIATAETDSVNIEIEKMGVPIALPETASKPQTASTAWQPSSIGSVPKSLATRFREAAPTPLQLALEWASKGKEA